MIYNFLLKSSTSVKSLVYFKTIFNPFDGPIEFFNWKLEGYLANEKLSLKEIKSCLVKQIG